MFHTWVSKNVSELPRKATQAAGISQEELALRINADQAYVSRVESGEMNVTLETVQQIADALKVDPRELVYVGDHEE